MPPRPNLPRFLRLRRPALLLALGLLPLHAQGPYSAGLNDPDNPYDAPIPGFIGPHGEGLAPLQTGENEFSNPDNILNPLFFSWASGIAGYSPTPSAGGAWINPSEALGPVTGDNFFVTSLGDLTQPELDANAAPGHITLTFDTPIRNKSGADFVVYENALGSATSLFAELAFVEVSSDGTNFVRFPVHTLNTTPVGQYDFTDPRNYYGLAGKHINAYGDSWGTPFDLSSLPASPLLNPDAVTHIRLVDIPGTGHFTDDLGNPIHDPVNTTDSAGFDLEALGVISRDITYPEWAEQQIPDPARRHPDAAPRGDGIPNRFAYALGRSGTLPDPAPVSRARLHNGRMHIEFTRDERTADLTLEVHLSTDLISWTPIARSTAGQPFTPLAPHTPLIEETAAHGIASVGVLRLVRIAAGSSAPSPHYLRLHIPPDTP